MILRTGAVSTIFCLSLLPPGPNGYNPNAVLDQAHRTPRRCSSSIQTHNQSHLTAVTYPSVLKNALSWKDWPSIGFVGTVGSKPSIILCSVRVVGERQICLFFCKNNWGENEGDSSGCWESCRAQRCGIDLVLFDSLSVSVYARCSWSYPFSSCLSEQLPVILLCTEAALRVQRNK